MKKLYTFLILAFTIMVGNAQIVTIPDNFFKSKLISAGVDTNGDFQIQLSEALAVTNLSIYNGSITDLTGIESFENLQYLNCSYNQISTINVNGLVHLISLDCRNNQISTLNISNLTNLTFLECSVNLLTSLNVSGLTNLGTFKCHNNQIPSLSVNGLVNLTVMDVSVNLLTTFNASGLTNLQNFACSSNQLTSLNVNGLTNLLYLDCHSNQLTLLNVSDLVNLLTIDCSYNQLTSIIGITVLSNLTYLICEHNQLTSLDASGLINVYSLTCRFNLLTNLNVSGMIGLRNLYCENNLLTSLDTSILVSLEYIYCDNNQISTLDLNSTNLIVVHCKNNNLISLFIKNGKSESGIDITQNPNLEYICADESQVNSLQTYVTANINPLCHVNSYCSFTPGGTFYTIQGNSKFDATANGCDASDITIPLQKININSGSVTGSLTSNVSGNYSIPVQAGTHTIIPQLENPTYFIISPVSATITFPTAASPFLQNFCVTANGVHNDLEISIVPIMPEPPGFNSKYKIIYKNKGTNTQSGTVILSYEGNKMYLVTATPNITSQASNTLSWNFSNLQPFETREILFTMHINSPTEVSPVNSGDVLHFTATVVGVTDETPIDNTATLNQLVTNSLDPNNKTCTEGTTVSSSAVGQYVHYIIRFENNGTANAQNIVVKDIIDATKYDVNSLVPLSGSASYTTRISNANQVEFIFQNINLPFDDANNDGYVAFKIKTKPTLVVGDTFSNTANIYFDYNFPITTNMYTTTITALGTQDFEFGSVFSLSPVPAKNVLIITTKQNEVMSSVNIYNMLGQLVQVSTNPNENIDVSGLKTGSYFIKIISDKGMASSKFVKE